MLFIQINKLSQYQKTELYEKMLTSTLCKPPRDPNSGAHAGQANMFLSNILNIVVRLSFLNDQNTEKQWHKSAAHCIVLQAHRAVDV